jgi:hypothetical protein
MCTTNKVHAATSGTTSDIPRNLNASRPFRTSRTSFTPDVTTNNNTYHGYPNVSKRPPSVRILSSFPRASERLTLLADEHTWNERIIPVVCTCTGIQHDESWRSTRRTFLSFFTNFVRPSLEGTHETRGDRVHDTSFIRWSLWSRPAPKGLICLYLYARNAC